MSKTDKDKAMNTISRAYASTVARTLVGLAMLLTLSACQAGDSGQGTPKPPKKGDTVMLGLIAYNYTDHYIDSYAVDGVGGGNVQVSTPTAGGGGEGCCIRWTVGTKLPVTVHVRWISNECTYMKNVDGEDFLSFKHRWSEQDVELTQPPSANPGMFETHFYPDGHVEVAITDWYTEPRLKLRSTKKGVRVGAKPFQECTAKQLKEWKD